MLSHLWKVSFLAGNQRQQKVLLGVSIEVALYRTVVIVIITKSQVTNCNKKGREETIAISSSSVVRNILHQGPKQTIVDVVSVACLIVVVVVVSILISQHLQRGMSWTHGIRFKDHCLFKVLF